MDEDWQGFGSDSNEAEEDLDKEVCVRVKFAFCELISCHRQYAMEGDGDVAEDGDGDVIIQVGQCLVMTLSKG